MECLPHENEVGVDVAVVRGVEVASHAGCHSSTTNEWFPVSPAIVGGLGEDGLGDSFGDATLAAHVPHSGRLSLVAVLMKVLLICYLLVRGVSLAGLVLH